MIVRRVFPDSESIAIREPEGKARLREFYAPPSTPWLRLNFIASVSGNAGGASGSSEELSSRVDRRILGAMRQLSDAVLIGAGSFRSEGYVRSKFTRLAVVTASGDLSGHAVVAADDPLIVLCPPSAHARIAETAGDIEIELVDVPLTGESIAATNIVTALHTHGIESIVCEGGPYLAEKLLSANLVDELCLTTSPVLNGASLPMFAAAHFAEKPLTLAQLLVDESSAVYARWLLRGAEPPASVR